MISSKYVIKHSLPNFFTLSMTGIDAKPVIISVTYVFLENVIFKEKYILWNTCSLLAFTICKDTRTRHLRDKGLELLLDKESLNYLLIEVDLYA